MPLWQTASLLAAALLLLAAAAPPLHATARPCCEEAYDEHEEPARQLAPLERPPLPLTQMDDLTIWAMPAGQELPPTQVPASGGRAAGAR